MAWRSSFKDGACAMIVSCALAKDFGAIISYEGEPADDVDSLIKNANAMLKEAENEA
jgi:predicted HD phosphohydrolase